MNFFIKEVSLTSETKPTATVTFNKGLNIICGVSDTGKSGILKTIRYFMNGDKPFKYEDTAYDTARIVIETPQGDITLSRGIKPRAPRKIELKSQNPNFPNAQYDVEYKDGSTLKPIDDFWFKLLGLEENPKIISTVDFARKRLTIKVLSFLFLLLRREMSKEDSIFVNNDGFDKTYRIASFIYLFSGNDFSEFETQEKDEIGAAKRKALNNFVEGQVSGMQKRISIIEDKFPNLSEIDIDGMAEQLVQELFSVEEKINFLTDSSKNIIQQLLPFRNRETEAVVLLKQFKELETQYKGDIQRLNLVLEGEEHFGHLEKNKACPFCNNQLDPETDLEYTETIKSELRRILGQLEGLVGTISDISLDLQEIRSQIDNLESKRLSISNEINDLLKPQATDLKRKIDTLQEYTRLQSEIEVIKELATTINDDLKEQTKVPKAKTKFVAKENLPLNFEKKMDEIAFDILKECQYEKLLTASFNISKFDLEINNAQKSTHGQGYLSFINTVCGLVMRKYIQDYAQHKVGLFIVDSPLLGLEQGDDETPESMRTGLFQYFLNHQHEGQMIIVENRKNLPPLDYEEAGAKVIEFTKGKSKSSFSESRDGFLYDVFD